ncbi:MAG TPA: hypothetical protein VLH84_04990 [Patescibacteria group bacterium]|nr:hypothetical protein [Patescibacteria group bacterium]
MKRRWLRIVIISVLASILLTAGSYFVHTGTSGTECPQRLNFICIQSGCKICAGGFPVPVTHGYPYSYADTWSSTQQMADAALASNDITVYKPLYAAFDLSMWFMACLVLWGVVEYAIVRASKAQRVTPRGK